MESSLGVQWRQVGRLKPFQDGGERGEAWNRLLASEVSFVRQVGAGQNPWKSVPYRFANNKTSSMETLVPNPCTSWDPPPFPASGDFYRRMGRKFGHARNREASPPRDYIYIKYDASLSMSKGSLFAFDTWKRIEESSGGRNYF